MDELSEPTTRIFKPNESINREAYKLASYYDAIRKEYLVQNERGGWIALTEMQFKRILKKHGFSASNPREGGLSPLEDRLVYLQRNNDVYYVGPLAGYSAGFYEIGKSRLLVTDSPEIIMPEKGEWPILNQFLTNLFVVGECNQLPFVHGWIKISFESLRNKQRRPGQALIMAGPHNCGKSLFQNLLTLILGGRSTKPYQYMMGITPFNADLFEAEHLAMEDEHASMDLRARRHFGTQIKGITVNESQRHHGKHQKGMVLYPFWRLSVSINDEPENLMVLPPIDDSLEDKVTLLKTVRQPMPMPTTTQDERTAFWNRLRAELPAYLEYLISWEIPQELLCPRFGIKHFHHPELLSAIDALAPEFRLLSLIDGQLFAPYGDHRWQGSSEELERTLVSEESKCRVEARRLFSFNTACGVYLGRLHKKYPHRVAKHRDSSSRTWTIHPPADRES